MTSRSSSEEVAISHEGLLFSKTFVLPLQPTDYKRVQVHMRVRLPLFLSPLTWCRYKFTLDNIRAVMGEFESRFIWLLAILHDIHISMSACSTSNFRGRVMFTGKIQTLNKISKQLVERYHIRVGSKDTLYASSLYRPMLPAIMISRETFAEFLRDERYILEYNGILLGLLVAYAEYLHLVRVISVQTKERLATDGDYIVFKHYLPNNPAFWIVDESVIGIAS